MTMLRKIVEVRKERVAKNKTLISEKQLLRVIGRTRPLVAAGSDVTVIAECKKASPSKGVFLREYDPVKLSLEYKRGGAHAVSIITEPDFFRGCDHDLVAVRNAIDLPLLRKDFIVDPYQIIETWALGADAILLIVAALAPKQLQEYDHQARELGLDVLVEVHDEPELETALNQTKARLIGVNARNLKDFSVDLNLGCALCAKIPGDKIAIAESGIGSIEDGIRLHSAGFKGFLIGEYFLTADDPCRRVVDFVEGLY